LAKTWKSLHHSEQGADEQVGHRDDNEPNDQRHTDGRV